MLLVDLFPSGVAFAEAYADSAEMHLLGAEPNIINRAIEKRQKEFATTRDLARKALNDIGFDSVPILRGEKGEPLWPKGVVGSLTHTTGYRGAVVAHGMQVRSVGIDAEPHEELPDGVWEHISIPEERAEFERFAGGEVHMQRVLFCAKEATYKTWFPLAKRWLGFEDAHITFQHDTATSGTFHTKLLVDGTTIDGGVPLTNFTGKWNVKGGFIITAITLN